MAMTDSARDSRGRRVKWTDSGRETACQALLGALTVSDNERHPAVNVSCPQCGAIPGGDCAMARSDSGPGPHVERIAQLMSVRMVLSYSADLTRLSDCRLESIGRFVNSRACSVCGAAEGEWCRWGAARTPMRACPERFADWIMDAAPGFIDPGILDLLDLRECSHPCRYDRIAEIVGRSGLPASRDDDERQYFGTAWLAMRVVRSYGNIVVLRIQHQDMFGFHYDLKGGFSIVSRGSEPARYEPDGRLYLRSCREASPLMRVGIKDLASICDMIGMGTAMHRDQAAAIDADHVPPSSSSPGYAPLPLKCRTMCRTSARPASCAPGLARLLANTLQARLMLLAADCSRVKAVAGARISERVAWELELELQHVRTAMSVWIDEIRGLEDLENGNGQ